MIRLISIDDHKLFSDGLEAIISREKDMLFLKRCQDGGDIISLLSEYDPDIILLDMYLPQKSGIAIAKEIKDMHPAIKVIILSLEVSRVFVSELEEIGVDAYISKELDAEELLAAIRKVYAGEKIYGNDSTISSSLEDVLTKDFGLTNRELQIYYYIRNGKSSQEIAEILNRSLMTILTHRKNIRQKIKTSIRSHDELFENDTLTAFLKED